MSKVSSLVATCSVLSVASFAWSASASPPAQLPPAAAPSAGGEPDRPLTSPSAAPLAVAPAPLPPTGVSEAPLPPPFEPARSADVDAFRFPGKSVGVFVSPLGLLFGVVGAELDFKLASFATLNVGGSYLHRTARASDYATTTDAFSGELGAQFYPFGRAFHQLYIYPRVSYGRASAVETGPRSLDASAVSTVLGAGATVGYQWTYDSGFSLRLGGGAMYFSAVGRDDGSTVEIALSGVLPAIDASLGWTF